MPPPANPPVRGAAAGGNLFTRKSGPLALWQWLAIIGGGIWIFLYYRSKQQSAANASTSGTDSSTTASDQVPSVIVQDFGGTSISSANATSSAQASTPSPATSPATGGHTPPQGAPPPPKLLTGAPKPPGTTTKSGSSTKTYTIKSGDTMAALGARYFGGGATEVNADKLYNFGTNAATIRQNAEAHGYKTDFVHWIFPGEVIQVPS